MSSPRKSARNAAKDDPYDISQDAEILRESDQEKRLRRESQIKKKKEDALVKATRQSLVVKMNPPVEGVDCEEGGLVVTAAGEFLCATCPRSFRSIIGRQRHMAKCRTAEGLCPCCNDDVNTCHQEGEVTCNECEGLFADEDALNRHTDIMHRNNASFSCAVCPRIYFEKEQLIKHLLIHSDEKPWMCKKCNAVFTRKYHLDRHFKQSGCDGFKSESNVCQVCGRSFSRKDNLREHLRAHAGINKRLTVYTCEYCNEVIAGLNPYNQHKREFHVGDKPYKCSYCPMRFTTSGAMKKHMRTHTGEKPYQCKECLRKFAAKETLNRHMRTHSTEKPFECPHCQKRFIQHSQLRAHIFVHTGVPDFSCDRCSETFRRKQQLVQHNRIVHEGVTPMECNSCDKMFLNKRELLQHVLVHVGIKQYKCNTCDKSFAQKAYLKVHHLTHTREQPRSCNYCNRAFIRQDCLVRHMRTRHKDMIEQILIEAERKKLQMQLMEFSKNEASSSTPDISEQLPASIADLLNILVDEDTLRGFGSPDAPVDDVLKRVIKRCGHTPVEDAGLTKLDLLRENAKLLFTVVIDDAGVKSLLNNQSVDEVIQHVLGLVKS